MLNRTHYYLYTEALCKAEIIANNEWRLLRSYNFLAILMKWVKISARCLGELPESTSWTVQKLTWNTNSHTQLKQNIGINLRDWTSWWRRQHWEPPSTCFSCTRRSSSAHLVGWQGRRADRAGSAGWRNPPAVLWAHQKRHSCSSCWLRGGGGTRDSVSFEFWCVQGSRRTR